MKLKIELVPETRFYKNLRNKLPKLEWDKIRKMVYKRAHYQCEICGAKGRLSCHEKWSYDDNNCIQKLEGFEALCDNCHRIKHMGFVNVQISKGLWPKSITEELAQHFMNVNNVTRKDFEEHVDEAFRKWTERSPKEWKVNMDKWKETLNPHQNTTLNKFLLKEF